MSGGPVKLGHMFEAGLVGLLIRLLRPLSPPAASRLGSAMLGAIGPLIPTSRIADMNLCLAMPELGPAARRKIIRQCWQNLGATAAELVRIGEIGPLIPGAPGPGFSVLGWDEHVAPVLARGGPVIFFTGHLGNWEILSPSAFAQGLDLGFMYRAASNGLVDDMIQRLREANFGRKLKMFAKGRAGARAAYAHLAKGGALGLLVDQKLDTGLSVPFFGQDAMTMDALASFALKFRCPVIPAYVQRIGPARFNVICEAPLALPAGDDQGDAALAVTLAMNQILERWIRQEPGAWLWLHRRWPKDCYKTRRR